MNLSNASRTRLSKVPGLNKALDFICARANEVFSQQHNNETGVHTDITADSLTLNGSGSVLRPIRMEVLNDNNVVTLTQDGRDVLTIRKYVVGGLPSEVFIPNSANGVGTVVGNVMAVGRNTSGNGAPGALELFDKSGAGWFFWVDTTGVLRVADVLPQEDGTPADTSGTVVGSTLLHALSGTDTNAGATNVDTYAVSGLTELDQLIVLASFGNNAANTNGVSLYNNTGALTLFEQTDNASIHVMRAVLSHTTGIGVFGIGETYGSTSGVAAAFKTAAFTWTNPFTLALRHGGVGGGDTVNWKWAIHKRAGQ